LEADNPYNQLLMAKTNQEATSASLNEAFLESAPQLIIQTTFLLFPSIVGIKNKGIYSGQ